MWDEKEKASRSSLINRRSTSNYGHVSVTIPEEMDHTSDSGKFYAGVPFLNMCEQCVCDALAACATPCARMKTLLFNITADSAYTIQ